MLSFIKEGVRSAVSGDKNRYTSPDGTSLDLSYITDRLIAMAFPAEGVEAVYRNDINQVADMFRRRHGATKVKVYNLCSERRYDDYDDGPFNGMVVRWCGFPDHHPPPLLMLARLVNSMHEWLAAEEDNVCAVHCLAGKGRTGTVISSYLVFSGLFDKASEALAYFALKRSRNNWGVTNPSQRRYVEYAQRIYADRQEPRIHSRRKLHRLVIHPLPHYDYGSRAPTFDIFNYSRGRMRLISSSRNHGVRLAPNQKQVCWDHLDITLQGDILVQLRCQDELMCYVVFHTGMLELSEDLCCVFERSEIDDAYKSKRFPADFRMELHLAEMTRAPKLQERPARGHTMSFSGQVAEGLADLPPEFFRRDPATQTYIGTMPFRGSSTALADKVMAARNAISRDLVRSVEKGGYLEKEGGNVKSWRLRWFSMRGGTLRYFKSPKHSNEAGSIPLAHVLDIQPEATMPLSSSDISFSSILPSALSAPVRCMLTVGGQLWVACDHLYIYECADGRLRSRITVGKRITAITSLGGQVWVSLADGSVLVYNQYFELQREETEVLSSPCVALIHVDVENDEGTVQAEVWAVCNDSSVHTFGGRESSTNLGRTVYCAEVIEGDVWLGGRSELLVVEADLLRVARRIVLPPSATHVTGIRKVRSEVYCVALSGTLHVISANNEIVSTIDTGSPVHSVALIEQQLWLGSAGLLFVVDCLSNRRLVEIKARSKNLHVAIAACGDAIVCATNNNKLCVYSVKERKKWLFKVVTAQREFLFNALTREDREEWIEALTAGVGAVSRGGALSASLHTMDLGNDGESGKRRDTQ